MMRTQHSSLLLQRGARRRESLVTAFTAHPFTPQPARILLWSKILMILEATGNHAIKYTSFFQGILSSRECAGAPKLASPRTPRRAIFERALVRQSWLGNSCVATRDATSFRAKLLNYAPRSTMRPCPKRKPQRSKHPLNGLKRIAHLVARCKVFWKRR